MDTQSRQLTTVHPAPAPDGLALSPNGRTLYVNYRATGFGGTPGHDAIARFDANTGAFLGAITGIPNVGSWIAVSPAGNTVWADGLDACWSTRYDHLGCPIVPAGLVNILDPTLKRVIGTIPFSASYQPDSLAFSPDGRLAVLTGDVLQILDPATFHELARIENRSFRGFAFHPDGRIAYSALNNENSVAILSFDTSALPASK